MGNLEEELLVESKIDEASLMLVGPDAVLIDFISSKSDKTSWSFNIGGR